MYDAEVTDRALLLVSQKQKWTLRRHTHAQIQGAITHFNTLRDEDTGDLVRPLTSDESRFIQNERRVCSLDFHYHASRYVKIVDWQKHEVYFTPNVAQEIVLDIWADLERQGRAIMMQQLKARQLGVTTLTEIAVAHRVQFRARVNAVVASADPTKSVKMANMIKFAWEQQPWWLKPAATKIQNGMPVEFGELNSSILIQAGNQFNGVARGQTPNVCHLSELCEWDNADLLVDAALLKAIHETPDVFVILESTALGRGNWWHDTWKQTKEDFPTGRSRLCPIFLPWYVGVDIYPTETDLRMRPIPASWVPADLTIRHAERAREYVLTNPLMFKYLAKGSSTWQMSRAQMWYYEIERDAAIKKKQLNLFLSEMPADDQEAFQSTNISAFDPEVIMVHRDHVRTPEAVYAITGTGIPKDLVADTRKRDWTRPPIFIDTGDLLPKGKEVYELIPLLFEGYPASAAGLKLFVYEHPRLNETYGLGVDTSDGIGQDWSVIEGLRKAFPQGPDVQVCEFASPYIKAMQLWPMTLALSTWYSVFQVKQGRRVQIRLAIECRGNGETVQFELQKRGWVNFHPWKKRDNKIPTTNDQVYKIGVFTSSWYRPMMLDRLMTMLEDQSLMVWSPWFVDEMEALEKDEHKQSMKAVFGEHDDRLMSLGFILDSLHVDDRPYGRSAYAAEHRYAPVQVPEEKPQYASFSPPLQAQDLPNRIAQLPSRMPRSGGLMRLINPGMPKRYR